MHFFCSSTLSNAHPYNIILCTKMQNNSVCMSQERDTLLLGLRYTQQRRWWWRQRWFLLLASWELLTYIPRWPFCNVQLDELCSDVHMRTVSPRSVLQFSNQTNKVARYPHLAGTVKRQIRPISTFIVGFEQYFKVSSHDSKVKKRLFLTVFCLY